MALRFIGTCVGLRAPAIHAFDDTARDIACSTFRKHLGSSDFLELEASLGYDKSLRLKDDWAVRFYKGKYKGKPAICMKHSSIHHFWELPN